MRNWFASASLFHTERGGGLYTAGAHKPGRNHLCYLDVISPSFLSKWYRMDSSFCGSDGVCLKVAHFVTASCFSVTLFLLINKNFWKILVQLHLIARQCDIMPQHILLIEWAVRSGVTILINEGSMSQQSLLQNLMVLQLGQVPFLIWPIGCSVTQWLGLMWVYHSLLQTCFISNHSL